MILPSIFKPILWSYDFDKCDPLRMKKTIILQTLKYGTLKHWQWIRSFYGDEVVRKILFGIRETEIAPKTKPLIETVFNFNNWNHAPRGLKR